MHTSSARPPGDAVGLDLSVADVHENPRKRFARQVTEAEEIGVPGRADRVAELQMHWYALDAMRLDAFRESAAAETDHVQARVAKRRTASTAIQCDPRLTWKLRSDSMKAQGR